MNSSNLSLQISANRGFVFIFMISLFALASSLILDLAFDVKPCRLCAIQRLFFIVLAFASCAGIFIQEKFLILGLIALFSAACIAVSLYHLVVQLGIVSDPCSIGIPKDMQGLKDALFNKQASCSKITLVAGIPLSVWSLLFSLACLIISGKILIAHRRNTQTD